MSYAAQGGPSACARCRDPSLWWHGARKAIRINSIRIPQEDMWHAPLSRLSQGEAHDTREHHTRTIAYPIRICCPDHWLKVSKPCYVIWTACHRPYSAAIRWCVRTSFTPCIPDLLMTQDFKASVLHVSELSIAFAMDSKELSSISDCFGDQKAIKTPKLNTIWIKFIARVLNMLIGLKGDNYYSKVFIRVNYKLWNSTFWVVINGFSLVWLLICNWDISWMLDKPFFVT